MLISFFTISFSELMENDIEKAVACAKHIVSEQGITAWYVVLVCVCVCVFPPSSSIEM